MIEAILDRLVLWYLKKTGKCFISHGKYGWKIVLVCHPAANVVLTKHTVKLANSKRIELEDLEED